MCCFIVSLARFYFPKSEFHINSFIVIFSLLFFFSIILARVKIIRENVCLLHNFPLLCISHPFSAEGILLWFSPLKFVLNLFLGENKMSKSSFKNKNS